MAKKARKGTRGAGYDASATITPQKTEFDDHFLDVVGNEFKFDHAKGLAELIKNSADAYRTTAKVKDSEQFILLRFRLGIPKKLSVFECIDFVGMTKENIDKALKVWGLPTAAKKGTDIATFGGHGNGGKFYMRQMFRTARYITYRGGKLNVFGFDEKHKYGYAKGCDDVDMSFEDALKLAEIDRLDIPKAVVDRWKRNPKAAGFTVVRGEQPHRFSGKATVPSILEKLRLHPQARRVLRHLEVVYLAYGEVWGKRLEPPRIDAKTGFEEPRVIPLPKKFDHKGETLEFQGKKPASGRLVLYTSQQPLARSSELGSMNTVDILGEVGCIASYPMNELGFMTFAPESEFIYGELEAPFLESKELDSVRNDRERLVKNDLTDGLIEWLRQQVDALAGEMAEKRDVDKRSRDLRDSALFNQLLDRWKNKFMAKLTGELFGGAGIGGTFGGTGGGGETKVPKGEGSTGDGRDRAGEKEEEYGGGGGDEKRKGPRFPSVLLSSQDADPLSDKGETVDCDPRHPPVYQRVVDIPAGIYWINTSRPLADRILKKYTADHPRWREYLFQRYVDIILKQSVHELAKRDPDFTADKVDGLVDQVTSKVHDAASTDLDEFLFNETVTRSAAKGGRLRGSFKEEQGGDGGEEADASDNDAGESGEGPGIPSMGEVLRQQFRKVSKDG